MIRLLLSILLFVMVMLIDFAKADAQAIIRPGVISIEERSVTDDLNGRVIVPALNENQGIVRISVARNSYFSVHDVARWLRNGDMTFDRVEMETSNVSVRSDDSIQMNFNHGFIGSSETVERRLQIRHPEAYFENYFDFIRLYKQKVVTLHIGVERDPQFAETFVPTGSLIVESDESEVDVVIFNDQGERIADRLLIVPSPEGGIFSTEFTNIPVGNYIVRVSKEGFSTTTRSNIQVLSGRPVTERIVLNEFEPVINQSENVSTDLYANSGSGSVGLDFTLSPNFSTTSLSTGFTPDPFTYDILAGGSVDVSMEIPGPDCFGYASSAPDFRLNWSGSTDYLTIFFTADDPDDDTVLIVRTPNGDWLCNDDANDDTFNPLLNLNNYPSGQFDIWIGTYSEYSEEGYINGTLTITELEDENEEQLPPDEEVRVITEVSAEPIGGMGAFASYIGDNLEYPETARMMGIQGRVFIRAIVNIDGSLSDISIVRSVGGGLDEEAERIVREYPGWVPGTQGGRPVRSYITLPILFSLN